jgi:hypothetical protein
VFNDGMIFGFHLTVGYFHRGTLVFR